MIVNSELEKVVCMANGVTLKLVEWSGAISFMIVPMDDLKVVLGKEYTRMEKVVPIPYLTYSCFQDKTLTSFQE